MGYLLKQSSTQRELLFMMVLSSDHLTGATGLSPTVTIRKAGGGSTWVTPTGSVTEVGSGWYQVAANATDTNTLGPLLLHASAATADACDDRFEVVSFDPQSASNLGLSALPTAAFGAAGGLADLVVASGTASAGSANTITLGVSAAAYIGNVIYISNGTGSGQSAVIVSAGGTGNEVATVSANWTTQPDNTSQYEILAIKAPALDGAARAGIDWSNIGAGTTTQNLSGTTLAHVTVGGYATGEDPGSYVLATPGNKLSTNSSGNVTVGGYATGEDPGTLVLASPAHKLVTDSSGYVTAGLVGTGAIGSASFGSGAITAGALASGAIGAAAVFTVDGLAIDSALEAMLATILGVTNVSGNQVSFLHQDGETTKVTVTYGTEAGLRTGSLIGS